MTSPHFVEEGFEGAKWDPILDKICNDGLEVCVDEEDGIYITITAILRETILCRTCHEQWMSRDFDGKIRGAPHLDGSFDYSCSLYIHECFEVNRGDEDCSLFKIMIEGTEHCVCHRFVEFEDIQKQIA